MKHFFCILAVVFFAASVSAQNNSSSYKTALGVKVYPGAVSLKHFYKENKAIEALGYISSDGFRLTALYELHGNQTMGVEGLRWYIGGGAHLGLWSDRWKTAYPARNNGLAIGVDGVLGLDYKVLGAPLNISFDWQPSFNIIGYNYFEGGWGGIGLRYTF